MRLAITQNNYFYNWRQLRANFFYERILRASCLHARLLVQASTRILQASCLHAKLSVQASTCVLQASCLPAS